MKLFIINLDRAVERRNRVKEQLSGLNVDYEFFSAVDGFKGLPEELKSKPDDKYRIKFRGRPLTPGEKGVYASHYLLWKKCIELNEPIAIFEDDFLPTAFFEQVMLKLPELHRNFDYLRLEPQDTNHRNKMIMNTPDGFQVVMWMDNAGGARGYSLTPKAAEKFVNKSEHWLCAVDNFIGESFRHKIPSLGLLPYAVFDPADLESQIQNQVSRTRVPLHYKVFREASRLYRDTKLMYWNKIKFKSYL
ncbi:glycosyltransferase family 25 protein [Vibrio salinus]|uniref:glycosyltransferase family 25 protein n=1 Tax=Vibrio salinus TaxID=2899784 RepID=UPI001E441FDC|nr:glycosyltransferase family 25 protein [Vibrio salinus]MCE0493747.1 glycosyltransferase family 25 protein [Vibrio salinus]